MAVFLTISGTKTQGILEFLSIMAVGFLPIVPVVAFFYPKNSFSRGRTIPLHQASGTQFAKEAQSRKHKLYGGPLYWFEVNGEAFSITDEATFHALQEIEDEFMTIYYTPERLGNTLLSVEVIQT